MALVPEDGTGLANANALASLTYCNTYHSDRGTSTWTGDDADKEAAIVRATAYLSEKYDWMGYRLKGRQDSEGAQALAWPRQGVIDQEGIYVNTDEIPIEVQKATAELALYELVNPGALDPTYTASGVIKSVKAGPVSVTFENDQTHSGSIRPVLLRVNDLIGQFLKTSSSGNRLSGTSIRV